nr:unnamed protein product [Salmo salar]|eukprot:XP_014030030.1 PREDICTED: interferon alpha/beta receptor 1a-like [Salmo salar]
MGEGLKPKVVDSSNNLVMLPELEAWTWYCVMIQSRYDYYNKTSVYTEPQCMQTEGDTPYGQIFLYFLVSMVVCFLLVLLPSYAFFRFYRVLKNTFYPSIQLPAHIQEGRSGGEPIRRDQEVGSVGGERVGRRKTSGRGGCGCVCLRKNGERRAG